jgi:hypothetical protein
VPFVLGDLGEDRRQLGDLVNRRFGVVRTGVLRQGLVALLATCGDVSGDIGHPLAWQPLLDVRRVAGLSPAFLAGGLLGGSRRWRFVRTLRRWWLVSIFEVAESGFEFEIAGFELTQEFGQNPARGTLGKRISRGRLHPRMMANATKSRKVNSPVVNGYSMSSTNLGIDATHSPMY